MVRIRKRETLHAKAERMTSLGRWLMGVMGWFLGVVVLGAVGMILWSAANSRWNDSLFYKVVLIDDGEVLIRGINKSEGRGVEVVIPRNLMTPVVGMGGELRAGSLWRFGDDEGRPEEIVERSLELLLGVTLEGVWRVKEVGRQVHFWQLSWVLGRSGKWWEGIAFLSSWNALRMDQIERVELRGALLNEELLPDGESVFRAEALQLWSIMSKTWPSSEMLDSKNGVRIVNATGIAGMGRVAERMVSAAGGLVVEVVAGEQVEGLCVVVGAESLIKTWVEDYLGCDGREGTNEDLEVVLGEEWGKDYAR